jgi:hypothetical protein
MSAVSVTGSPRWTLPGAAETMTRSGTPSTSHRRSRCQNVKKVVSSSGIDACIRQSSESWGVKASDLPRP